ncbi:MAG TPA: carboxypeptidase-like regulatory domain-containing protein, partial [Blastocatellia bacterium]|nr:carboxypeptidase-like regulatory domain-containing protein [Blastocatellia bacterium]
MQNHRKRSRSLLSTSVPLAILLTLFLTSVASAQVLYGSIVGNVTDNSNAVVAGATVKITNKATNQVRETTTNESGGYTFTTVQTGIWEVTVSKQGFKTSTNANVIVTLNNITRADMGLEIGQVVDTVNVTADAGLLQTDRAEVRAELNSQTLQNIPIPPGRNYQQLLRTLPGITPPTNAHSIPTNPS